MLARAAPTLQPCCMPRLRRAPRRFTVLDTHVRSPPSVYSEGASLRARAAVATPPEEKPRANVYVSQVVSSQNAKDDVFAGAKTQTGFGGKGKGAGKGKAGAKAGFGGGKGTGKGKPAAKRSDAELIRAANKEYDGLCERQAKLNKAFLEYVVSVRDGGKGQLSDWLPICQLTVLLDDDEHPESAATRPDLHSVVCCAVSQRKAAIAALTRKVVGQSAVKGMLQFAYEPEPSFRVALNALGGMEDSAAVAAMALLHLEADATPAAVRAAYRKTAAQWHPDKFATKPPEERAAAQRTFQKAKEAYETLQGSRIQKGQLFADLGGSERDGFSHALALDQSVVRGEGDVTHAREMAAVVALEMDVAVTPFAVRNIMHAKRLTTEGA